MHNQRRSIKAEGVGLHGISARYVEVSDNHATIHSNIVQIMCHLRPIVNDPVNQITH